MFEDHDKESGGKPEGDFPLVDLSHSQIVTENSAADGMTSSAQKRRRGGASLAATLSHWRSGVSLRLANADLAPDLAENIGSKRWLRGAATLAGLTALSLAFWPGFSSVEAAPAMTIDDRVRDEFRSQMIMPLALGADSGHRMGATPVVVELDNAPERPRLDLVATLADGDGFDRMLRRAGVANDEATLIAGMVAQAVPADDLESGTQVDITLGRRPSTDAPRPVDALSFRARFDLQLVVERVDGALRLDPRPIVVDATPLRVRGTVGDSLYRSARAAGAPPGAVQDFLRTLGQEMNLNREIGAADEFDMIVEYRRAATGEVEVGDLLYAAIIRDDRPRKQLMRFGREGRFYDAAGEGVTREGLIRPVPGAVSSRYGMRRHPILGYRRMHGGVDFRARHGTPIYAASDGVVNFAARNGGLGNFVRIRHEGGLSTGYAHMSRIGVRNGESVRRGQVIGYVGSTGLSTGPHLHYEMYRNGQKIDPLSVRWVTRAQLTRAEMANFREQLVRLQQVAPGAALTDLPPDPSQVDEPVREIDRIENRQRVS